MKKCPFCQHAPHWHFARNVSASRRVRHFIFAACCERGELFPRNLAPVAIEECAKVETEWDSFCETLFAVYTSRWTEPQRIAYRARIWPSVVVVPPSELFRREVGGEEVPAARHFSEPQEAEDCPWLEAP